MPGENTIAVHTYYQGLINRVWISGDGRHGLLLDLVVDGKEKTKTIYLRADKINEIIFFTREEAEKALKWGADNGWIKTLPVLWE